MGFTIFCMLKILKPMYILGYGENVWAFNVNLPQFQNSVDLNAVHFNLTNQQVQKFNEKMPSDCIEVKRKF
jgi:hypothetical protein